MTDPSSEDESHLGESLGLLLVLAAASLLAMIGFYTVTMWLLRLVW